MVERTLLWKLGALAPVGTMLCFVVQHQFLKDSFNPISIDGRVDSRIDAYVPIVREIEQANFEKKSNFAKAEQLASKWADQSRQKVFEPLLPCFYGDDFDDGPRSQVLAASISLVDELARYSISEAQSRKYIHAVKLIETAMDQLEDLKYSDITALRLTITKQTRLLGTLRWIDAKANHSFSDVVKAERSKFEIQPDKLESLARHMKSLYVQYYQRYVGIDSSLVSEKALDTYMQAILRTARKDATRADQALIGQQGSFAGIPEFLIKLHLSVVESQHHLTRDWARNAIALGPGSYPVPLLRPAVTVAREVTPRKYEFYRLDQFPSKRANVPIPSQSTAAQGFAR